MAQGSLRTGIQAERSYPTVSPRGSVTVAPPVLGARAGTGTLCKPFRSHEVPVANIKSQKKRILTNAKRAERNKAVKSELKTRIKTAQAGSGSPESAEDIRMAVKRLDMAAAKGIIHKNTAARRKSRLMKRINSAG